MNTRVATLAAVMSVSLLALLAVPFAGAQDGEWQFKSHENYGPPFGPAMWLERPNASLLVICPADSDRFEVSVDWSTGNIAGTIDIRPELADISIKLDDGRVMTEQWVTMHRRMQLNLGDGAVGFLRQLLDARQLTVFADFIGGETRMETFDLTALDDMMTLMAPECEPIQSFWGRP